MSPVSPVTVTPPLPINTNCLKTSHFHSVNLLHGVVLIICMKMRSTLLWFPYAIEGYFSPAPSNLLKHINQIEK